MNDEVADPTTAGFGDLLLVDGLLDIPAILGLSTTEALLLTDLRHSNDNLADERRDIIMGWLGHSKNDEILDADKGPDATRRADRIQRALTFISTHIETKLTTTELANISGVSARTISDDFRAVFHKAVLAYVTAERMRVALKLLQDRSLALEQVASKVGFQCTFSFTKAFVRTYGHMPVKPMTDA